MNDKDRNEHAESDKGKQGPPLDHRDKEIFTFRKHLMDYFTADGVRIMTGYDNERDWYLLPIRELLDNGVDFLQKNYKGSDMARIAADIRMDDRLFRLKIRNSNVNNIAVFPNLGAIFNFDMKYGSKQDVHIISRGMLGNALKQVLSLGYVLTQSSASNTISFKDRQWDLPLILRYNKKEWLVYVKVYNTKQEYEVTIEPTENQVPFSDTEIELRLPMIDQVRDSLTRDYVEQFCMKYALPTTDISFKFRIVDSITRYVKPDGVSPADLGQDIINAITKVPPKGILPIDVPALHPIANDWRNRDSVQSKNPEEFMRRFHNIHDKNAYSIYDVLIQFKEGTQIKKSAENEQSVSQLVSSKNSHKKMEKLFYELRKYSDPDAQLELPYTSNPKKRKEMLYKRIAESGLYNIRGEDKAVYKLVREIYQHPNGIIQYPYAFEIMAIPFILKNTSDDPTESIVIGAVNYSISPKPNTFEAEYFPGDKGNKNIKTNIFRVLELYDFRNWADSWVKLPCLIFANLITPRREPLTHDKSAVDAQPFISGISTAVAKMAKDIQTYRGDNWTFSHPTGGRPKGEHGGDKPTGKMTYQEMAQKVMDIIRGLNRRNIDPDYLDNCKVYVDAANPEFITTLKELVGETVRWEYIQDKILYCKKHNLDLARYMTVVPVAFSASAKDMIMHTKELLEHERPLIAINPKFEKLITALRTATSDDQGKLNKEETSYDNVLDAFRLALKGINLVKKDIQK